MEFVKFGDCRNSQVMLGDINEGVIDKIIQGELTELRMETLPKLGRVYVHFLLQKLVKEIFFHFSSTTATTLIFTHHLILSSVN